MKTRMASVAEVQRGSARNGSKPAPADDELRCEGSNHVPGCEHTPRVTASVPHGMTLPVASIDVADNVRRELGDLTELAASIKAVGILQPITVTAKGDRFVVVMGHRRLAAARLAGLDVVPVLTTGAHLAEGQSRRVQQLVENIQRADLNALEEAEAIRTLVDNGLSQAEVARQLGRAPSSIANTLGVLEAPAAIREHVRTGRLTLSHTKALKGLAPKTQVELATRAVAQGRSSHGLEEDVQRHRQSEEWRKERENAERTTAEENAERTKASLGALEKKKIPKDAAIIVPSYYGNSGQTGHVAKLIRELGFTNVKEPGRSVARRSQAKDCDCAVWKVELTWSGKVSVVPGCVAEKHQRAKTDADIQRRSDHWNLITRVREALPAAVAPMAEASAHPFGPGVVLSSELARMVLWDALGYAGADWAEAHGAKRSNPWPAIKALSDDELAKELAKAVARAFNDQYGLHLPWNEVASDLGIGTEPEPAEKAGRKAS